MFNPGDPMIYCFDIDGTLCTNTEGKYLEAIPFQEVVARVNYLYSRGHRILLYTARGSTTGIDWREVTKNQLKEWNVYYHKLFMSKPTADVYIDDKAINFSDWKNNNFRVNLSSSSNKSKKENYE